MKQLCCFRPLFQSTCFFQGIDELRTRSDLHIWIKVYLEKYLCTFLCKPNYSELQKTRVLSCRVFSYNLTRSCLFMSFMTWNRNIHNEDTFHLYRRPSLRISICFDRKIFRSFNRDINLQPDSCWVGYKKLRNWRRAYSSISYDIVHSLFQAQRIHIEKEQKEDKYSEFRGDYCQWVWSKVPY